MAKTEEKVRALESARKHQENAQKLLASGLNADALLELNHAVDILARAMKTNFCELPPELRDQDQEEEKEPALLDVLKTLEENTKNLLTQEDLDMMHKVRKARNNEAHFSGPANPEENYDWVDTACRQMASLLKDRAPNLLYGPAYEPLANRIYYVDTVLDGVNRARKVMDETHVLDAAAMRLGQSLELIARVGVFDCMPALLGAPLDDSLAAMEYEGLFAAEDLQEMRHIQGMRNQAAHASESPLTEQEVRDACNWMEKFAYGPLCDLLQMNYAQAKEELQQATQQVQKEYEKENRKNMVNAGQRSLMTVGYWALTVCLALIGLLTVMFGVVTAATMVIFVLVSTFFSSFTVSRLPQIGEYKKGVQDFLAVASDKLNDFSSTFVVWDVLAFIGIAGTKSYLNSGSSSMSVLGYICMLIFIIVGVFCGIGMMVKMYKTYKAIRQAAGAIEMQEVTDLDVRYRTPEEMKQDIEKIRTDFVDTQKGHLIMMTVILVVDIVVFLIVW